MSSPHFFKIIFPFVLAEKKLVIFTTLCVSQQPLNYLSIRFCKLLHA